MREKSKQSEDILRMDRKIETDREQKIQNPIKEKRKKCKKQFMKKRPRKKEKESCI